MSPEEVLAREPKVLAPAQRAFYFDNGYLLLDRVLTDDRLSGLRAAADQIVAATGSLTSSTPTIGLHPDHTAQRPMLTGIFNVDEESDAIWRFVSNSELTDIVGDLLGPDLRFHHTLLFFKRPGRHFGWHQDIAYYPHTNASPLTVGVHLDDCGPKNARTVVIPGSHNGELFDHNDEAGDFAGLIAKPDLARLDVSAKVELTAPAGSVEIFNSRTVHADNMGAEEDGGACLHVGYTAADAMPYCPVAWRSQRYGTIVRGRPARFARHDREGCPVPRDSAARDRALSFEDRGTSLP